MIGTKLAHFTITAHLGSGGMGEVYQATDSKLGRSVAIKLLPEAFVHDTERVARFEREARALASLNHPNIAAIHGIEQSGERKFLVMELVGGETLAERIKHGPIPVNEALDIAKQIAEALEAAHDSGKGVIHRDLKPANVKITPDGKAKVLDFGLAKAYEPGISSANLSNSPTMASMTVTNAGVILGTAAYMSPEQAKGRTVDRRTDIFALGCVLYEMLTGRAAFEGDDLADILSRVLQREPEWTLLPADVPPRIRELLKLCLQKDARKRRSDAADVRIDIEQALANPVGAQAVPPVQGSHLAWIVAAAAMLTAAGLAIPALRYMRGTPPPFLPEVRTEIATPAATTDPTSFALSPDGSQIVFAAFGDGVSQLWLRSLASTAAKPLDGTEGAVRPFWSPDSRSVGFFADGKLKRLDIGGGRPQALANTVAPRGGAWNAAGVILFEPTGGPLFRIPASGGEAVAVTKLERQTSHRFPFFLPDGRQFLFYATGTPEASGIFLSSLDSAETRRLTPADTAGVYLTSGWLLWVRAGTLVAQRLDLAQRTLAGDPVTVADPVVSDVSTFASAASVSATGLVAYRTGAAVRTQLTWFNYAGKTLAVMDAPQDSSILTSTHISPDGRRAAVHRTVQGNTNIWLLDGTRASPFTFDAALERNPIWSPDGSRIVFDSNRKGTRDLYVKPSSGAGSEELLLESQQDKVATDWSPDGRSIIYHSNDPQTGWDLWVKPLEGDRKPWLFLRTNFSERYGQFSPNGRWVAYASNESGRLEIYLRPFLERGAPGESGDRTDGKWPVSIAGGVFPRWRGDGKELYYIGPDGQMMAVSITDKGATVEPGAPRVLFQTRIVGGGSDTGPAYYDVDREGRFLITEVPDDASASPITLLQNWKPPTR